MAVVLTGNCIWSGHPAAVMLATIIHQTSEAVIPHLDLELDSYCSLFTVDMTKSFRRTNGFVLATVVMNYHAVWITCKGTKTTDRF